jgi:hypothetical protein
MTRDVRLSALHRGIYGVRPRAGIEFLRPRRSASSSRPLVVAEGGFPKPPGCCLQGNARDTASRPAHAMPRDEHPRRTGRPNGVTDNASVKLRAPQTVDMLFTATRVTREKCRSGVAFRQIVTCTEIFTLWRVRRRRRRHVVRSSVVNRSTVSAKCYVEDDIAQAADQERIAVGRRRYHRLGADHRAGAGAVLHRDRLSEPPRELIGNDAAEDVIAAGRSARRS